MNEHNYVKCIGGPGENLWQCQALECRDSGPLSELMSRACPHVLAPGEAERNLLNAIDPEGS